MFAFCNNLNGALNQKMMLPTPQPTTLAAAVEKVRDSIVTGDFMRDQEIPIEVHHTMEIIMHKSTKSPLRKLQMRRLMPPEVAPFSRNKAALPS